MNDNDEINFDVVQPDRQQVLDARLCAGLTQEQAAACVHLNDKARWSEYERGARMMDTARWELFLIKNALHPEYYTKKR